MYSFYKITPPIIPKLTDNFDVSNFDAEFTNEGNFYWMNLKKKTEPINSIVNTDSKLL